MRLDPNDYQAHWALGWAYLYNWEHEKAMASYQRARDLNPNDAELLAEMANFLVYIGQPKQAIDQLTEAIRLNPNHEHWYVEYLGWAYEDAGMPSEAIEIFERAVDLRNPRDDQLWFLPTLAAAYAYPTVGRMDDAHGSSRRYCHFGRSSRLRKLCLGLSLQDKGTHRQVCECAASSRTTGVTMRLIRGALEVALDIFRMSL